MNKFVKFGVIAGIVMILGGICMAAASFAMGANPKRIGYLFYDRFHIFDGYGHHGVDVSDDGVRVSAGHHGVSITDDGIRVSPEEYGVSITDDSVQVAGGSRSAVIREGNFEAGYLNVSDLEIIQNGGTVDIFTMDEIEKLTVKSNGGKIENIRYEDHRGSAEMAVEVLAGEEYQIFIPSNWRFENFEADVAGGALNGEKLNARETEITTGGGVVRVSQRDAGKVEIECRGGSVEWSTDECQAPGVEAECSGGTVVLEFPADMDMKNFGYSIECEGGTVKFPNFTVEGRNEKKALGETGMPWLDLETKGGTIEVLQKEE